MHDDRVQVHGDDRCGAAAMKQTANRCGDLHCELIPVAHRGRPGWGSDNGCKCFETLSDRRQTLIRARLAELFDQIEANERALAAFSDRFDQLRDLIRVVGDPDQPVAADAAMQQIQQVLYGRAL